MATDLVSAFNSQEIGVRIAAIEQLARQPNDARVQLAAILSDRRSGTRVRVWAMIALCQVRCDSGDVAEEALLGCLGDPEAVIRRSAIETLGHLKIEAAVSRIAARLSDDGVIEEAWFDDASPPSEAARRALRAIGSPEALALLTQNDKR